jgi:hypothetical protein
MSSKLPGSSSPSGLSHAKPLTCLTPLTCSQCSGHAQAQFATWYEISAHKGYSLDYLSNAVMLSTLQICDPVCEPPQCRHECAPLASSTCDVKCSKPKCEIRCPAAHCEKGNCPECTTVCSEPECRSECMNPAVSSDSVCCFACHSTGMYQLTFVMQPSCKTTCEKPACDWRCHKPAMCARPKCALVCETNPTCAQQAPTLATDATQLIHQA